CQALTGNQPVDTQRHVGRASLRSHHQSAFLTRANRSRIYTDANLPAWRSTAFRIHLALKTPGVILSRHPASRPASLEDRTTECRQARHAPHSDKVIHTICVQV